ncbi:TetR family transcriptional regulator [Salinarimonas soli]|uniref:TetR/AcrR family transcriptional regulator n=1 Tax=Salinarimonas soli TaxID=1638099 RepID=A0A5B2VDY6_9HYPH|nr:TetR family transcriptional regulator [Salinarimonas soli]KAA2236846.1 TetR/AcrR family transcriptional regulator [Salinarimonas soli]
MLGSTQKPSVDARLLAIAGAHLRRFGRRRLTVVGVAEDAGMTHANVYRYFPSKSDLVDAVVAQWLKTLEVDLAAIADAPDPADDKLERLLLAVAHAHRDCLESDPNLFDAYAGAAQALRPVVRKHRARQRALLERVLDEGVAADAFRPRDRERAAAFVIDAVYRFINPVAVRADAEAPRDVLDTRLSVMIRVILRSLASGSV